MDIVVKDATKSLDRGDWIKITYDSTVYLRRQDNLIIAIYMNIKCPKKTNRWVLDPGPSTQVPHHLPEQSSQAHYQEVSWQGPFE